MIENNSPISTYTPGTIVRLDHGKGHPATKRVHIREIVDEEFIVFRYWSKRKQRWLYEIQHRTYFDFYREQGRSKIIKLDHAKFHIR